LAQSDVEQQKKFNYFFYQAIEKRRQAKFDEAVEYLQRCKELQPQTATVYYELSAINSLCGNQKEAFDLLQKAAQLDSQNVYYKERLLPYYISSKQQEKAIEICLFLIDKKPQEESYFYALINLFVETKRFSEALLQLDKLEKRNGVEEHISFEKIKFFLQLNQKKKAEQEIRKLIATFPSRTDYVTLLGNFFLDEGEHKKAFDIYTSLLKKNPNDAVTKISLVKYYEIKNDVQTADSLILEIIANDYVGLDAKMKIIEESVLQLKSDQRKMNLTEKVFSILLAKHGENERTQLFYFTYLFSRKQNEKALEVAESILEKNPFYEDLWVYRIELSAKKDAHELLAIVDEALQYYPQSSQFYYIKALQLSFSKRNEEAVESISQAILFTDPNNAQMLSVFWGLKGDFLSSLDRGEEAESAYENSLTFNPNELSVLNNYAYMLAKQKRNLKKAERMSAKTVEAEPSNAIYLDTYAWIFFMKEDFRSARFYVERAIAQDGGKNSEIYLHYGDILSVLGEEEAALKAWQKAAELGDDSEELKLKIENSQK
jgi:tetratricopeptide (TPR) repeat protein